MKRNLGSMTGFLAILAIALHTAFPTAQEGGGATSTASEKKSGANKGVGGIGDGDELPEGPWLATQAYFRRSPVPLSNENKPPALKDQTGVVLRNLFGVPDEARIYSIVATVPDPLHTRLALLFDETIDAIERAAEHQGWVFSNQWLPWLDPANGSEDGINARRSQRRLLRQQESFPGILVFRCRDLAKCEKRESPRNKPVLFVFLVPDSPTGGIAGDSFSAALNLANLLPPAKGPQNEIGLLAPSFSGSFQSLAVLLKQWFDLKRSGPKLHEEIFGGRISSYASAGVFTNTLNADRKHQFRFHSGIVSSEQYRDVFECEVLSRYRVNREEAAYLVEQETGFAVGLASGFTKPEDHTGECESVKGHSPLKVFRFPRDIAHLRNAYRETGQAAGTRNPSVLPSVDFTLKDPTRGEDSIPAFSETGSSMTQSASLDLILQEMKQERIGMVYLAATNPLDMIFVTQVVRKESPETRVVVADSPSILFVPAAGQEALQGTLFLSTYPMFFHGYEWLNANKVVVDEEPLTYEQGLTNTAQLLLTEISHVPIGDLRGYTRLESGYSDRQHPGLWLLTLTPSGFFPVDWFNAGSADEWLKLYNPKPDEPKAGAATLEQRFPVPEPPLGWYLTAWGVSIVIFAVCVLLLRSNFRKRPPLWLTLTDNYRARIPSLVGASLSLSALEGILLIPALHVEWSIRLLGTMLAGWAAFVAPLASTFRVLKKARDDGDFRGKCPRLRDLLYPGLFILIYGLVLMLWAISCGGLGNAVAPADLLLKVRSVQLYSGASPALPLLLLGALFFGTFTIYFYRFTQNGKGRPRLAVAACSGRMQYSYAAVENFIGGPGKLPADKLKQRLLVCLVLIGISGLIVWGRIRPFEQGYYHFALGLTICVLALALAAGCYDLWFTWRNLKRILKSLKLDPLDEAFVRVAKSWVRRPVWAFWRSVPEESLGTQMKRALYKRIHVAGEAVKDAQNDFDRMRTATDIRFGNQPDDRLASIEAYQVAIASLGGKMADVANRDDYPLDIPADPDALNPSEQYLCHSADFVALYYCNYLIYAAMQMQCIAWGVTLSMVMLTVVLNSYSVQDPLIVGRFVAAVFVVVAIIVGAVFAGMERDPILSCIARTKAGELNAEFWFQIAAMGLLPAIGVLTHLFPSMASFLSSWVAPTLDASR